MTVEEYLAAKPKERLMYRLTRNPLILFVLAPIFVFLVRHRFAPPGSRMKVHASVWTTNLGIALMGWGLGYALGWMPWLIIQISIMALAGSAGFWLFYVQHQFEGVYWDRAGAWDYARAALNGSSFYRLPKILQWFTGNIGFHHIHHLSHRIPNYNLEECHRSHPAFSQVKTLSLRESFDSLRYRLWDEASKTLISFKQLRMLRRLTGTASEPAR
jgi:acyl-lipid omega-6 desaturase (Delta-12 desaturase)